MAHRISGASGRDEIAYAGSTPWHGLGVKVDALQTPQDMLAHAGMLWTVEAEPVFVRGAEVQGYKAIVRQDTARVLGVTTSRYHAIQNTQAAEVVDALVTEGGAYVEVAGVLDEGQRCWMLARIPGDFEVVKGDVVQPYFLLAWGHDGKHGLAGKLTSTRVVCHNTLTAAGLGDGVKWSQAADIYVRHSGNAVIRIDEARTALGIAKRQVERTAEAYQALAGVKMEDADVLAYFERVWERPESEDQPDAEYDRKLARWQEHQDALKALYEAGAGSGLVGVRGSAWGAYNAVTEWTDHRYPVLQSGEVSATRTQSVLFGSYAATKAKAFAEALSLVK